MGNGFSRRRSLQPGANGRRRRNRNTTINENNNVSNPDGNNENYDGNVHGGDSNPNGNGNRVVPYGPRDPSRRLGDSYLGRSSRQAQHYANMNVNTNPSVRCVAEPHKAITIRNNVNLKRATLRLEKDDQNPGFHLVAFSFDATLFGRISIFFLAKEGPNCCLTSLKPYLYTPVQAQFEKGLGQKFKQAPGTGVNLSLFDEVDLVNEGQNEVFPLIVRAETVPKDISPGAYIRDNDPPGAPLPMWVHSQTTHAALEKNCHGEYHARVVKQIIWVDGVRYELQEIYGIDNNDAGSELDDGKECVICLSEPRDTTVLPCRHMCMCSNCAKVLRCQTNHCPICRTTVERLLEMKISKNVEMPIKTVEDNCMDGAAVSHENP